MGIESDQVVYEYLSRVGDVAHRQQLPSSARMRLVSQLRDEIDRRRAKVAVDSPAAVHRILTRIGTPEEIVAKAGGTPAAPDTPSAAVPLQREDGEPPARTRRLRRGIPKPRAADPGTFAPTTGPSSPHVAPAHELGDPSTQPDWWRTDSTPFGPGDEVPGFIGGVEIPELLKPPPRKDQREERGEPAPDDDEEPGAGPEGSSQEWEESDEAEDRPTSRRSRRFLRLPASREWHNPLLLLAAALLLAGAVLGNLIALAVGWLIAWASRRLTRAEMKTAVMILPALTVTAGLVWLWGRTEGRWGDPIAEGQMRAALDETWPWVLRAAAVTSAAFLIWRSQRQRQG
ncbi:hypothetical protein ACFXAZ_07610 [Streptomyces sp. NPDC059477]|uniref:hypothetical protein n=1 Tax=Streptomyces sp. NPDC059477 TaxID=3346847 RepID=UPI003674D449